MEKERLILTINRYDHFYDLVNNKGNVILGLSTFILGVAVAGYPTLNELFNFEIWGNINLIAIILFGIASNTTLLLASVPHLTPGSKSLFYFESVSKISFEEFKKASIEMDKDSELEDLREQSFLLASGLNGKFKKLKLATIFNLFQIGLLLPFTFYLICNLK